MVVLFLRRVYVAPDKPAIDFIATTDNSALVHFLSSEHRTPKNPGTDFYVEYAHEDNAGQSAATKD